MRYLYARFVSLLSLCSLLVMAGCSAVPDAGPAADHAATYEQWAVACDHPLASQAGAEMLAAGGNAVDAAVAASFCLSVVRPFSCGIGGGGFMVISLPATADPAQPDGRAIALDYRETCPAAVGPDFYATLPAGASERGARSSGVPGTVAGLLYTLEHYGTLDRATVLAPAIAAAREGFAADEAFVKATQILGEIRRDHPELRAGLAAAWARFARHGERAVGEVVVNQPQAEALELIARDGAAAFYSGPIAAAIMAVMAREHGTLTQADLAAYTVRERPALVGDCGPWRILSMPPPSSGGVATLQVFGLLERLGGLTGRAGINSPHWRHLLVETFKHAFADRARWLADDAFFPVPVAALTAPAYLDSLAVHVDPEHTRTPDDYGTGDQLPTDAGTSHIAVLDARGMAVSCSETINLTWGAGVEVPGFGFMLNDEMDDFTTGAGANAFGLVQSDRNRPEPGKRPLSSMSPTIVLREGRCVAIAGASGGPRIISGTLQVLLAALVYGDDAGQAVARPRLHHQWRPDEVRVETGWTDEAVLDGLRRRGHKVVSYEKSVGVVQAIIVRDGQITAASDPRKGGRPAGR